jgi:hypothetical protein
MQMSYTRGQLNLTNFVPFRCPLLPRISGRIGVLRSDTVSDPTLIPFEFAYRLGDLTAW